MRTVRAARDGLSRGAKRRATAVHDTGKRETAASGETSWAPPHVASLRAAVPRRLPAPPPCASHHSPSAHGIHQREGRACRDRLTRLVVATIRPGARSTRAALGAWRSGRAFTTEITETPFGRHGRRPEKRALRTIRSRFYAVPLDLVETPRRIVPMRNPTLILNF